MGAILVIGEIADGAPTRLTLELATLAQELASGGGGVAVLLVDTDEAGATAIAALGPDVLLGQSPRSDAAGIATLAVELMARRPFDVVLIGATPEGKDVAGALLALTDLPVLVAADAVRVVDGSVTVEMNSFGGRAVTASAFVAGRGIVLVRPGAAEPTPAATPGTVHPLTLTPSRTLPQVTLVERTAAPAAGPSIDGARIIVGAGRGVDGAAGLALVEELAQALDGVVGATRAAVDAGWIDFAQQIGQTGRTVKPELYLAAGVSGAIQHRVGVQNAGTVIAIDQDREAPITEFADLVVIGDLFEVLPALTAGIRARKQAGS